MVESSARITFQQGLLESQEPSKLDIGFLTRCVNWVPEPNGALRVRAGWSKGSVAGVPATRRNRGIGMFTRFTDPTIVQSATAHVTWTGGQPSTPSLSWAVPTTIGNMLVAFISVAANAAGTSATTATGWTARQALSSTWTANTAVTGVYELVTTTSFSGATTPFTIAASTASGDVTVYILEVAGVATFDQIASATATTQAVTVTTTATTQASELVLGFDTLFQQTSTATTLSTSSTDFTEYAETDSTASSNYHSAAVYSVTVRATGVQTITVSSSQAANNKHSATLITYKGWNAIATPLETSNAWLTAAWNGTGVVDIYAVDRPTLPTATYSVIDANRPNTGNLVAFVNGLGAAYYTASSFTSGIRKYDGNTASAITGSPIGARCIAIHYSRLWAAVGTRLYFSQIGDATEWDLGDGYFDFGLEDGEPIEDITPFNGGLVIGKRTSLHFLSGSTNDASATGFIPVPLDGGGAAPGRSILATPYGCVIAGLDQVWSFDGSQVRPLGRGVERSYGLAETDFVTTSYIDGVIYIAAPSLGKVFAYQLNPGTWYTEDVGGALDEGAVVPSLTESAAVLYNYGGTQLYGPMAGTIGSLLNFRTFPDPARVKDFDPLPETFVAQTGDLALAGTRRPISPRQMFMQLRQRGGDESEPGLLVTPVFDGVDGATCDVDSDESGVRRTSVEGFAQNDGTGINTVGIRIEQTLASGDASVTDIEDCYIDVTVENPRP